MEHMKLQTVFLIVDDFHIVRKTIKHQLRSLGFTNIEEASDGKTALDVLAQKKIDFIISDWNMPGINGLEFLKQVRQDERHAATPFLFLTAEATEKAIQLAIQAGTTNYVVKPFTFETLARKIKAILK